jgi:branched-chain amino acid transport system ATP-binding protein
LASPEQLGAASASAGTPGDEVLGVSGLEAGYGPKTVLFGVDLEVRAGEVVGIVGHNGAGKSTLLQTVFGAIQPTAGTVRFLGEEIARRNPQRNVRAGMALVPSERFVFGELSVRENLLLGALWVKSPAERERRLRAVHDQFPILNERSRQLAGSFSGGQQRMLSLGMGLMQNPRLMLFDEPSLGIAPAVAARIFGMLRDLVSNGSLSILIVEQNIPQLLRIVDRVYVMRAGRLVAEESAREMRARSNYWDLF